MQQVRRYHLQASHQTGQQLGGITQTQVAMTTIGFAGLALIRPYLFGISTANQKERKAFLHFWAVVNNLIGVQDEFNICLLPIKAAEIEFDIIMRNVLAPYVQLETLAFKRMVSVMLAGLSPFVENIDYDSQMFLVKRALGIPGYQLDVNYTREVPYGNIFSDQDVAMIKQHLPRFSEKLQIYSVIKSDSVSECLDFYTQKVDPFNLTTLADFDRATPNQVKRLMGLPCDTKLKVKELERGPSYLRYLSAKAINHLPSRSQFNVNMFLAIVSLMKFPKGVLLANQIVDSRISLMRKEKLSNVIDFQRVYPNAYIRGVGV